MPTHRELALMSEQVYFRNGGLVDGWECSDYYSDPNGLAAAVYKNKKNNEMVIAFRGTDTINANNLLMNLLTNAKLTLGYLPNTLSQAQKFIDKIRTKRDTFERLSNFLSASFTENQLYLTGHSLGAILAELVGCHFISQGKNYKIVTFESPGGYADFIPENDQKALLQKFKVQMLTYLSAIFR